MFLHIECSTQDFLNKEFHIGFSFSPIISSAIGPPMPTPCYSINVVTVFCTLSSRCSISLSSFMKVCMRLV